MPSVEAQPEPTPVEPAESTPPPESGGSPEPDTTGEVVRDGWRVIATTTSADAVRSVLRQVLDALAGARGPSARESLTALREECRVRLDELDPDWDRPPATDDPPAYVLDDSRRATVELYEDAREESAAPPVPTQLDPAGPGPTGPVSGSLSAPPGGSLHGLLDPGGSGGPRGLVFSGDRGCVLEVTRALREHGGVRQVLDDLSGRMDVDVLAQLLGGVFTPTSHEVLLQRLARGYATAVWVVRPSAGGRPGPEGEQVAVAGSSGSAGRAWESRLRPMHMVTVRRPRVGERFGGEEFKEDRFTGWFVLEDPDAEGPDGKVVPQPFRLTLDRELFKGGEEHPLPVVLRGAVLMVFGQDGSLGQVPWKRPSSGDTGQLPGTKPAGVEAQGSEPLMSGPLTSGPLVAGQLDLHALLDPADSVMPHATPGQPAGGHGSDPTAGASAPTATFDGGAGSEQDFDVVMGEAAEAPPESGPATGTFGRPGPGSLDAGSGEAAGSTRPPAPFPVAGDRRKSGQAGLDEGGRPVRAQRLPIRGEASGSSGRSVSGPRRPLVPRSRVGDGRLGVGQDQGLLGADQVGGWRPVEVRGDGSRLFEAVEESARLQGVRLPPGVDGVESMYRLAGDWLLANTDDPGLADLRLRSAGHLVVDGLDDTDVGELIGDSPPEPSPERLAEMREDVANERLQQAAWWRGIDPTGLGLERLLELMPDYDGQEVTDADLEPLIERYQWTARRENLAKRINDRDEDVLNNLEVKRLLFWEEGDAPGRARLVQLAVDRLRGPEEALPVNVYLLAAAMREPVLRASAIGEDVPKVLPLALGVNIAVYEDGRVAGVFLPLRRTVYVERVNRNNYRALEPPPPPPPPPPRRRGRAQGAPDRADRVAAGLRPVPQPGAVDGPSVLTLTGAAGGAVVGFVGGLRAGGFVPGHVVYFAERVGPSRDPEEADADGFRRWLHLDGTGRRWGELAITHEIDRATAGRSPEGTVLVVFRDPGALVWDPSGSSLVERVVRQAQTLPSRVRALAYDSGREIWVEVHPDGSVTDRGGRPGDVGVSLRVSAAPELAEHQRRPRVGQDGRPVIVYATELPNPREVFITRTVPSNSQVPFGNKQYPLSGLAERPVWFQVSQYGAEAILPNGTRRLLAGFSLTADQLAHLQVESVRGGGTEVQIPIHVRAVTSQRPPFQKGNRYWIVSLDTTRISLDDSVFNRCVDSRLPVPEVTVDAGRTFVVATYWDPVTGRWRQAIAAPGSSSSLNDRLDDILRRLKMRELVGGRLAPSQLVVPTQLGDMRVLEAGLASAVVDGFGRQGVALPEGVMDAASGSQQAGPSAEGGPPAQSSGAGQSPDEASDEVMGSPGASIPRLRNPDGFTSRGRAVAPDRAAREPAGLQPVRQPGAVDGPAVLMLTEAAEQGAVEFVDGLRAGGFIPGHVAYFAERVGPSRDPEEADADGFRRWLHLDGTGRRWGELAITHEIDRATAGRSPEGTVLVVFRDPGALVRDPSGSSLVERVVRQAQTLPSRVRALAYDSGREIWVEVHPDGSVTDRGQTPGQVAASLSGPVPELAEHQRRPRVRQGGRPVIVYATDLANPREVFITRTVQSNACVSIGNKQYPLSGLTGQVWIQVSQYGAEVILADGSRRLLAGFSLTAKQLERQLIDSVVPDGATEVQIPEGVRAVTSPRRAAQVGTGEARRWRVSRARDIMLDRSVFDKIVADGWPVPEMTVDVGRTFKVATYWDPVTGRWRQGIEPPSSSSSTNKQLSNVLGHVGGAEIVGGRLAPSQLVVPTPLGDMRVLEAGLASAVVDGFRRQGAALPDSVTDAASLWRYVHRWVGEGRGGFVGLGSVGQVVVDGLSDDDVAVFMDGMDVPPLDVAQIVAVVSAARSWQLRQLAAPSDVDPSLSVDDLLAEVPGFAGSAGGVEADLAALRQEHARQYRRTSLAELIDQDGQDWFSRLVHSLGEGSERLSPGGARTLESLLLPTVVQALSDVGSLVAFENGPDGVTQYGQQFGSGVAVVYLWRDRGRFLVLQPVDPAGASGAQQAERGAEGGEASREASAAREEWLRQVFGPDVPNHPDYQAMVDAMEVLDGLRPADAGFQTVAVYLEAVARQVLHIDDDAPVGLTDYEELFRMTNDAVRTNHAGSLDDLAAYAWSWGKAVQRDDDPAQTPGAGGPHGAPAGGPPRPAWDAGSKIPRRRSPDGVTSHELVSGVPAEAAAKALAADQDVDMDRPAPAGAGDEVESSLDDVDMDSGSSAGEESAGAAAGDGFPAYRAEDYERPGRMAAAAAAGGAGVGSSRGVGGVGSASRAGVGGDEPRRLANAQGRQLQSRQLRSLLNSGNWDGFTDLVSAHLKAEFSVEEIADQLSMPAGDLAALLGLPAGSTGPADQGPAAARPAEPMQDDEGSEAEGSSDDEGSQVYPLVGPQPAPSSGAGHKRTGTAAEPSPGGRARPPVGGGAGRSVGQRVGAAPSHAGSQPRAADGGGRVVLGLPADVVEARHGAWMRPVNRHRGDADYATNCIPVSIAGANHLDDGGAYIAPPSGPYRLDLLRIWRPNRPIVQLRDYGQLLSLYEAADATKVRRPHGLVRKVPRPHGLVLVRARGARLFHPFNGVLEHDGVAFLDVWNASAAYFPARFDELAFMPLTDGFPDVSGLPPAFLPSADEAARPGHGARYAGAQPGSGLASIAEEPTDSGADPGPNPATDPNLPPERRVAPPGSPPEHDAGGSAAQQAIPVPGQTPGSAALTSAVLQTADRYHQLLQDFPSLALAAGRARQLMGELAEHAGDGQLVDYVDQVRAYQPLLRVLHEVNHALAQRPEQSSGSDDEPSAPDEGSDAEEEASRSVGRAQSPASPSLSSTASAEEGLPEPTHSVTTSSSDRDESNVDADVWSSDGGEPDSQTEASGSEAPVRADKSGPASAVRPAPEEPTAGPQPRDPVSVVAGELGLDGANRVSGLVGELAAFAGLPRRSGGAEPSDLGGLEALLGGRFRPHRRAVSVLVGLPPGAATVVVPRGGPNDAVMVARRPDGQLTVTERGADGPRPVTEQELAEVLHGSVAVPFDDAGLLAHVAPPRRAGGRLADTLVPVVDGPVDSADLPGVVADAAGRLRVPPGIRDVCVLYAANLLSTLFGSRRGVWAGLGVDDLAVGGGRAGELVVPGADWVPVRGWEPLRAALKEAGLRSVAVVLAHVSLQRGAPLTGGPGRVGHAYLVVHTGDGKVVWTDPLTGRVLDGPPELEPAGLARAVLLGPDGQEVPGVLGAAVESKAGPRPALDLAHPTIGIRKGKETAVGSSKRPAPEMETPPRPEKLAKTSMPVRGGRPAAGGVPAQTVADLDGDSSSLSELEGFASDHDGDVAVESLEDVSGYEEDEDLTGESAEDESDDPDEYLGSQTGAVAGKGKQPKSGSGKRVQHRARTTARSRAVRAQTEPYTARFVRLVMGRRGQPTEKIRLRQAKSYAGSEGVQSLRHLTIRLHESMRALRAQNALGLDLDSDPETQAMWIKGRLFIATNANETIDLVKHYLDQRLQNNNNNFTQAFSDLLLKEGQTNLAVGPAQLAKNKKKLVKRAKDKLRDAYLAERDAYLAEPSSDDPIPANRRNDTTRAFTKLDGIAYTDANPTTPEGVEELNAMMRDDAYRNHIIFVRHPPERVMHAEQKLVLALYSSGITPVEAGKIIIYGGYHACYWCGSPFAHARERGFEVEFNVNSANLFENALHTIVNNIPEVLQHPDGRPGNFLVDKARADAEAGLLTSVAAYSDVRLDPDSEVEEIIVDITQAPARADNTESDTDISEKEDGQFVRRRRMLIRREVDPNAAYASEGATPLPGEKAAELARLFKEGPQNDAVVLALIRQYLDKDDKENGGYTAWALQRAFKTHISRATIRVWAETGEAPDRAKLGRDRTEYAARVDAFVKKQGAELARLFKEGPQNDAVVLALIRRYLDEDDVSVLTLARAFNENRVAMSRTTIRVWDETGEAPDRAKLGRRGTEYAARMDAFVKNEGAELARLFKEGPQNDAVVLARIRRYLNEDDVSGLTLERSFNENRVPMSRLTIILWAETGKAPDRDRLGRGGMEFAAEEAFVKNEGAQLAELAEGPKNDDLVAGMIEEYHADGWSWKALERGFRENDFHITNEPLQRWAGGRRLTVQSLADAIGTSLTSKRPSWQSSYNNPSPENDKRLLGLVVKYNGEGVAWRKIAAGVSSGQLKANGRQVEKWRGKGKVTRETGVPQGTPLTGTEANDLWKAYLNRREKPDEFVRMLRDLRGRKKTDPAMAAALTRDGEVVLAPSIQKWRSGKGWRNAGKLTNAQLAHLARLFAEGNDPEFLKRADEYQKSKIPFADFGNLIDTKKKTVSRWIKLKRVAFGKGVVGQRRNEEARATARKNAQKYERLAREEAAAAAKASAADQDDVDLDRPAPVGAADEVESSPDDVDMGDSSPARTEESAPVAGLGDVDMDSGSSAGEESAGAAAGDGFPAYRAEDYERPGRMAAAAAAGGAGVGSSRGVGGVGSASRARVGGDEPRRLANAQGRRLRSLLNGGNWDGFTGQVSTHLKDGFSVEEIADQLSMPAGDLAALLGLPAGSTGPADQGPAAARPAEAMQDDEGSEAEGSSDG